MMYHVKDYPPIQHGDLQGSRSDPPSTVPLAPLGSQHYPLWDGETRSPVRRREVAFTGAGPSAVRLHECQLYRSENHSKLTETKKVMCSE